MQNTTNKKYNLHFIADKVVKSKNIGKYLQTVESKKNVNNIWTITEDKLIDLLNKSRSDLTKDYLDQIKNGSVIEGLIKQEETTSEFANIADNIEL
jgi:hypothetical protein